MGAFIIFYIVGSIVAIPILAYHLLRTRRDLNALRRELLASGVIAPEHEGTRDVLGISQDAARGLGHGSEAGSAASGARAAPADPPRRAV